jgi:hypothetical protein
VPLSEQLQELLVMLSALFGLAFSLDLCFDCGWSARKVSLLSQKKNTIIIECKQIDQESEDYP